MPVQKIGPDQLRVSVTNLKANTDYEYEIKLVDRARNEVRYGTFIIDQRPPAVTVNQAANIRALSARFDFAADETVSKAVLKVTKKSDGTEKQLVYNNLNQTALAALMGGFSASTDYEYSWELTDLSGNKTQTPKISFTTNAVDDPFFIENRVTGTNIALGSVSLRLNLVKRAQFGTFLYRKVGQTQWGTGGFGSVQDDTLGIVLLSLDKNTDYEYYVNVSYNTTITLPGGKTIQVPTSQSSQIQPFKTGNV